jgi:hypothetical protein
MCGSPPSPPPGPVPGNPPGGNAAGTGPCCACPADGDINTNGFSNYFTTTYSHSNSLINKGKIAVVRTEEGGTVTVTKSFSLAYSAGATEAAHKATITGAITSAMSSWQSAAADYRIQVEQPGCKPQKLKMLYASTIVASGADVAVTVNGSPATVPPAEGLRSFVQGGTAMRFYTNGIGDIPWTMIHEIGHTFGLPDEYIYTHPSATAPSFTMKGASDPAQTITLVKSAIAASTPATFGFDHDCVMGRNGNTVYYDYLFYWIAIETKKVLQAAGVSATVKVVPA